MFNSIKIQLVYWPTLLWNVLLGRWLKVRDWWTVIDDRLILGALPFRSDVAKLHAAGVRGVVNTCLEYKGPVSEYSQFDIEQLYIPTVDFTEPKLEDVISAVDFIDKQVDRGNRVYIHCKAGRARSATIALCWLCRRDHKSADEIQKLLLDKRKHVNPRIKDRQVVKKFLESLNQDAALTQKAQSTQSKLQ